ncbi:MAG: metallohydrolase [Candidatus Thiodiazotropha sp. (ex Dulcina madagascariensis)]|nr:metallohydrolase [Candidatus Thiodiazotropha sp. (ex Dulcina madagascariensis)]
MKAKLNLFSVGNGDMTLIQTESGKSILVDINIRAAADDPDDETPDVAAKLRDRLKRDVWGRLYVDAFLLSHPDRDHCAGLRNHFHLGSPDDWSEDEDKILIREMWSSPMVFRRASSKNTLYKDAKAFNSEARRRVQAFRDHGIDVDEGDRILILGEDENGKTDDLEAILIRVDETFSRVNGANDNSFSAYLLAPLPKDEDEEGEEKLSKNKSSTILQFSLSGEGYADKCRYLTGGDAEVAIWEKLWDKNKTDPDCLTYDVLLTPHHCSWHSLSYDSWSDLGEDAEVCQAARDALSQGRYGALLIASSNPIKNDKNDPPCISAKREYEDITDDFSGEFKCIGEDSDVLEVEVTKDGPKPLVRHLASATILGTGAIGRQPLGHG